MRPGGGDARRSHRRQRHPGRADRPPHPHYHRHIHAPGVVGPSALAALPGVDAVQRQGERIVVIGTNELIAPVCAAVLDADQLGPPDLRVHHPDLEDALIALISDTSPPTAAPTGRRPRPRRSLVMRALLRLAWTELKLFVREPMVLTFVFAFPVLTVLILGGVFDDDDPNFEGTLPSDYYVAAYIGVVIAAIGLVMLPVHLASYRERGVLRRFDVSHYPRWALPVAWILVAMVITAVAVTVLLVTGQLAYGLPAPDNLPAVIAAPCSARSPSSASASPWAWPCPAPAPPKASACCCSSPSSCSAAPATPRRHGRPHEHDRQRGPPHPRRARHPRTLARPRHPHQPPRRARRPRPAGHHRMDHPQHPSPHEPPTIVPRPTRCCVARCRSCHIVGCRFVIGMTDREAAL